METHLPQQYEALTRSSVVIIGAGFAGICAAIQLQESGIRDFIILEKSTGFGGTWKDNTYPGCSCDVPSHVYSFSFDQNPDWTRLHPPQTEILEYVENVAAKHGLYHHVRFNSEVTDAEWDPETKTWGIDVHVLPGKEAEACDNYTINAEFLVSGTGQLNVPYWPQIEGQHSFRGKSIHSARWDWSYDLRGKRIGVIGSGATATQIMPEIAKVASHVTMFQRSPNWVSPRMDMSIPGWAKSLLRSLPFVLGLLRTALWRIRESLYDPIVQRDSASRDMLRKILIDHMHEQLPDRPDLWDALTPDFQPGCRRIILNNEYYPAFLRPNVTLELGKIERITESGVLTRSQDGEGTEKMTELDLLIYATGFQTQDFMHGIRIQGDSEKTLGEIWESGPCALYGVGVESLPNFGMLYGPNTNLGHHSIVAMIEAQVRYITTLATTVIRAKRRGQIMSITPRTERIQEYNVELQKDLSKSTFADPRAHSWYKTEDGLITNNWRGTVRSYQDLMSVINWSDYDIDVDGKGASQKVPTGRTVIGRVPEDRYIGPKSVGGSLLLGGLFAVGLCHYRGWMPLQFK